MTSNASIIPNMYRNIPMVFLFSREHSDVATKLRHKGFRKMGSKQEEAFYDSVMPQKSSGNSKEDV